MIANEPPVVKKSILKLTSRVQNGNNYEMGFEVDGLLLTLLFVTPETGVELTETSIGFSEREWREGKFTKYLKITYGKSSSDKFSFSLKLKKSNVGSMLKITVVTIDSHFDKSPAVEEFQQLIDKFPDYVFVQQHQADVSSYTFD
jgi:hypothetical protein